MHYILERKEYFEYDMKKLASFRMRRALGIVREELILFAVSYNRILYVVFSKKKS